MFARIQDQSFKLSLNQQHLEPCQILTSMASMTIYESYMTLKDQALSEIFPLTRESSMIPPPQKKKKFHCFSYIFLLLLKSNNFSLFLSFNPFYFILNLLNIWGRGRMEKRLASRGFGKLILILVRLRETLITIYQKKNLYIFCSCIGGETPLFFAQGWKRKKKKKLSQNFTNESKIIYLTVPTFEKSVLKIPNVSIGSEDWRTDSI